MLNFNVCTIMILLKWIETHLQLRLQVNKVSSVDMEKYAMSLCISFYVRVSDVGIPLSNKSRLNVFKNAQLEEGTFNRVT